MGVSYVIRAKANSKLYEAAQPLTEELKDLIKDNFVDHAVVYGECYYKTDSWLYPRRIAVKLEKPQ